MRSNVKQCKGKRWRIHIWKACISAHGRALPEVGEREIKSRMTCRNWQKTNQRQLQTTGKSS